MHLIAFTESIKHKIKHQIIHNYRRQTKNANDGGVARATLTLYIIITVGLANNSQLITPQEILQTARKLFPWSLWLIHNYMTQRPIVNTSTGHPQRQCRRKASGRFG